MKKRPKVAVVLSGGGALGFAHIGVMDVLIKNKIPMDLIVGTSMGAVIGGSVSCGCSCKDLEDSVIKLKTRYLFDLCLSFKGVCSGKNALKYIKKVVPDIEQRDTKIPFICNAVDLITNEEVVLKEGSILKNIRASMSVPGVFAPVKYGEKLLVDGGVLNNMPHDIARKEGADIIIAVDVVSKSNTTGNVKNAV